MEKVLKFSTIFQDFKDKSGDQPCNPIFHKQTTKKFPLARSIIISRQMERIRGGKLPIVASKSVYSGLSEPHRQPRGE